MKSLLVLTIVSLAISQAGCATIAMKREQDRARQEELNESMIEAGIKPAGISKEEYMSRRAAFQDEEARREVRLQRIAEQREQEAKAAALALRRAYIAQHPQLDTRVKQAILKQSVIVGMTVADAEASIGTTSSHYISDGVGARWESLDYSWITLYFSAGRLVRWSMTTR